MSKVATVAWREFKQTVFRKVFLFAMLGIPILIVGAFMLIFVLTVGQPQPPLIGTIAIVDPTGEAFDAVRAEFDPDSLREERADQERELAEAGREMLESGRIGVAPQGARFEMGMNGTGEVRVSLQPFETPDPDTLGALKDRLIAGELLAYAIFTPDVLEVPDLDVDPDKRPRIQLVVADGLDADHVSFIERQLGQAVVRARSLREQMDPDRVRAVLDRPDSDTRRVMGSGVEAEESRELRGFRQQIIPVAFMMLLWIAVITSSQHLMMSTIEEKSNRVMEVLLSAVSPLQLVTGKILGHGGVGLLIVGLYSSLGVGLLVVLERLNLIDTMSLVYLAIYFFMAYFMVASLMAAVGSAVSDIREANTLVTPVMLVVMIPLILWMPISQDPNGAFATVFSFIPPAIPFVMILRVTADESVPLWQIPVTVVWGYACVVGMVWMAAKIFRVGVLMYGKPPSPVQLLRWVRYS